MQTGGPYYKVELGRLDGKVGTRAIVKHSLPGAGFDLDQLNKLFAANGLTQTDMIALSGNDILSLSLVFFDRQARTVRVKTCHNLFYERCELVVRSAGGSSPSPHPLQFHFLLLE